MLVLSRKTDESILLGNDIRITVLAVRGHQVRLGIEAPRWVTVLREELRGEALEGQGGTPAEPADPIAMISR